MDGDCPPGPAGDEAIRRLHRVLAAQKAAFAAQPYPSAAERRARLRALREQLCRHQDRLVEAMCADFGYRSPSESKMFDLLASVLAIDHLSARLKRWMKPSRRRPELLFRTNGLAVHYQPKGVVGVIVPWNFPIYLAVGPLAAALAAGNRVMVKMPEAAPATARAFARLIAEAFAEHDVAVVETPADTPGAFTALPFDHLVFTGSPATGRAVMAAAAANLTPVTLELGGKSPAIVCPGYPVAEAARRVMHGKGSNCGQICVAPDYVLVHRPQAEAFAAAAIGQFHHLFPAEAGDRTTVANDGQLARLQAMLADARAKGATIRPCAPYDPLRDGRRMPVHLILGGTAEMTVLREEIFGPLLPVIPYDTLDEAIAFVMARQRPLALYCFSRDRAEVRDLLARTQSGGVTVNDWGWHVVNHDAPFGGIGGSGMGSYHGIEGFQALSHARTVFTRRRFFPIDLFCPPYGSPIQRLVLRLFLGKADPALAAASTQGETGWTTTSS